MGLMRQLFGPSKEEIWGELARQIDAQLIHKPGLFGGDWKVEASHGEWTITLDTYTVSTGKSTTTFTRLRAPFVNKENFRFKIYRAGMFTKLGKMLGMQDVEVGNALFDEAFVIQGNNEAKLKQLFSNPLIVRHLESLMSVWFEVKDDEGWFSQGFPQGVDELVFTVPGIEKGLFNLRTKFELFSDTLDALLEMDAISDADPGVKLT